MTYLDTSSTIGEHLGYMYKVSVGRLGRVATIIQA
jgi:hypothetical protein